MGAGSLFASIISAVVAQLWRPKNMDPFEYLGLRLQGLLAAFMLPLLLTTLFCLGPISLLLFNYFQISSHSQIVSSEFFIVLRNVLLAPLCDLSVVAWLVLLHRVMCFVERNNICKTQLIIKLKTYGKVGFETNISTS
ncbi:hypothetical protein T11_233 [Trichinella zimbabwensis]|uniref:Uncharacterized protein n=1 Tax=Trichinella zimbabwensis TaxID=268475 RepID=A0A0V1HK76_9BILA|nr:hypothetical protein T11_233 [Trichinella zimbabwensis]